MHKVAEGHVLFPWPVILRGRGPCAVSDQLRYWPPNSYTMRAHAAAGVSQGARHSKGGLPLKHPDVGWESFFSNCMGGMPSTLMITLAVDHRFPLHCIMESMPCFEAPAQDCVSWTLHVQCLFYQTV